VEEVRATLSVAEAARRTLLQSIGAAALRPVLARLTTLTLHAADARRAEGRLEFHDLLVLARRLLRDHPEVCRDLSERWTRIFVDELQDTDPIQIELAVRIAAGVESGTGGPPVADWRDLAVEPGRLFFVGDPKQSIYRFRRADIAQFLAAREHFAGEPLQLTRNRRSVPGVISWVNAVFEDLIGAGAPDEQPAYVPIVAARDPLATPDTPVVVLGGLESGDLDQVRTEEAAAIAAAVCRVRDEQWPVAGPDGERAARLSDIAVLVPTRRTLSYLQEAFDAREIPYRLEGTSVVYQSPEVRDLVTVLRAVDDPTDEVAVVAALRTPLFGCGDDDLARFAAATGSGRWDYRRRRGGDDPASEELGEDPVDEGMRALLALHEARWWCEPSELIERVLVERRALELAVDRARPRESWRCLRYVADQARQYADVFGGDLRRYIRWVEHQQRDDVRATEAVLPERDHDAVRVMTVHAAKGLEFPVLILSGLNAGRGKGPGTPLLFGPDGMEAALSDVVRTPGYDDLETHERQMEESEQIRLLYVAATRARDHLIVSLHHAERARDSHAARLAAVCADHPRLWRRLADPPSQPEQQQFAVDVPGAAAASAAQDGEGVEAVRPAGDATDAHDPVEHRATRSRWAQGRRELLAAAAAPRTVSATGLAKLAAAAGDMARADGVEEADEPHEAERPAWRRGRAGTGVGRAVHAVLQTVDLATGDGIEALAEKEAWAEGVGARAPDVARLARAALDAEPVREAVECGRFWRELYVGAPFGDRVLEGFVDLLVDGPSGLTVVDYKTIRLGEPDAGGDQAAIDAALEGYRLQGAGYALAVGEVLGRAVERCAFVFLRPEGAVTRLVDDLPGATAVARSLLVAGGASTTVGADPSSRSLAEAI
jgi:ATP-dependent exoDNAse (exonuclease V) beta subunit